MTDAEARSGRHSRLVNAEDSAPARDLPAGNRTLPAWLRTAMALEGLGFAVARSRSGDKPDLAGGPAGIAMVAIGTFMTLAGLWQHQSIARQEHAGDAGAAADAVAHAGGGHRVRLRVRFPDRVPGCDDALRTQRRYPPS